MVCNIVSAPGVQLFRYVCVCMLLQNIEHTSTCYIVSLCWLTISVVQLLSHVRLFVIPWTVAHQASLSMGFSRKEYWSVLLIPSQGDLPRLGIEPMSPIPESRFFTTKPPGKPKLFTSEQHQESVIFNTKALTLEQVKFNPAQPRKARLEPMGRYPLQADFG